MLVGQEINRPYQRGPLSGQYLRRQMTRDALSIHSGDWYHEHDVRLITHCRVARLDLARSGAALDNGQEVSFEHLLVATGASAMALGIPGEALPNVHHLRSMEDVDALHNAIDKARVEGRVHTGGRGTAAVIGAGVLGVETAASLLQLGLAVELIVGADFPWSHLVGDATGRQLSRFLQKQGVRVHGGERAARIEGDGRVQRVVTDAGVSIDCDFVVAAAGVAPNKDLLRNTAVRAEKAILVDEFCRTNLPEVYAAGDCAAIMDPLFGKHRMLHSWNAAAITGVIAGANMSGGSRSFGEVTSVSSEVFGVALRVWGEPRLADRRLVRGTPGGEGVDCAEVGVGADGRVVHAAAIGRSAEHDTLEEMVRRRIVIDGNQETIKDPSSNLRTLVP
jgi:3-phenylpropionate/trans-cinnamate dioxygenase ferredoxin reductase subunit